MSCAVKQAREKAELHGKCTQMLIGNLEATSGVAMMARRP